MALRCFLQVWCGRGGSTNFFLCVASLCERLCNATLHSPSAAAELTCYSVGATPSNYFLVLLRPLCDAWPHPPRARNAGSQARLRSRSDHFLIQVVDWNLMVFLVGSSLNFCAPLFFHGSCGAVSPRTFTKPDLCISVTVQPNWTRKGFCFLGYVPSSNCSVPIKV